MVITIISFILLVILLWLLASYFIINIRKKEPILKHSFVSDVNLTDMILIKTEIEGLRTVFLLDTGAVISTIDKSLTDQLSYELLESSNILWGISGDLNSSYTMTVPFEFKGHQFSQSMLITELSDISKKIKDSTGITIHGILGIDFLKSNKIILDFDTLTFYIK